MLYGEVPLLHILVLYLGVHRIDRGGRAGKEDTSERTSLAWMWIGRHDRGTLKEISNSQIWSGGAVVHRLRGDEGNRRLGIVQRIVVREVIDDPVCGTHHPIRLGAPGQANSRTKIEVSGRPDVLRQSKLIGELDPIRKEGIQRIHSRGVQINVRRNDQLLSIKVVPSNLPLDAGEKCIDLPAKPGIDGEVGQQSVIV